MKYSVLIIDDEPAAIENLNNIIEKYCDEFEVIACADGGEQGIEMAHRLKPDLTLVDIRMPQVNGLEVVREIHESKLNTKCIIVSGYQDFEYARTALRYGAINYILKPVSPTSLNEVLSQALPVLSDLFNQSRIDIIRSIAKGHIPENAMLQKFFPEQKYIAALTRKNGLPNRFQFSPSSEIISEKEEFLVLYGRDEMECLTLLPAGLISISELAEYSRKPYLDSDSYITTIIWENEFKIEEIADVINKMYKALSNHLVLGHTQIVKINATTKPDNQKLDDGESLSSLSRLSREANVGTRNKLLFDLMKKWNKELRPMIWVEQMMIKMISDMQVNHLITTSNYFWPGALDDTFYSASNFKELWQSICDILDELNDKGNIIKLSDNQKMFESIQNYVNKHFNEQLTLHLICRQFGISQPYLSQLFRKYSNLTFNRYLTDLRITKAKEMFTADRNIQIKEVAQAIGYEDQFYFSRIFRSYTGLSPTEFIERS